VLVLLLACCPVVVTVAMLLPAGVQVWAAFEQQAALAACLLLLPASAPSRRWLADPTHPYPSACLSLHPVLQLTTPRAGQTSGLEGRLAGKPGGAPSQPAQHPHFHCVIITPLSLAGGCGGSAVQCSACLLSSRS
jgi:hypothetical protein